MKAVLTHITMKRWNRQTVKVIKLRKYLLLFFTLTNCCLSSGQPAQGQLVRPAYLAVDLSGNVYVTELERHRIQKFDKTGALTAQLGSFGSANGQLNSPQGIAVDSHGNVYVVDSRNFRIQKFSGTGSFLTKWSTPGALGNQRSYTIALDSNDNVYVTVEALTSVHVFDNTGRFLNSWAGSIGTGDRQFQGVGELTIDTSGNIYISDIGNHRIQKFSNAGAFIGWLGKCTSGTNCNIVNQKSNGFDCNALTCAGQSLGSADGQFMQPRGLALDSRGNIYVSDFLNDRIQKFDNAGNFVSQWGSRGSGDGQFRRPTGIAIDPWDNVYVADTGNNRIQKFNSMGTLISVWGADVRMSASPGEAPGIADPIVLRPSETKSSTIKIESINSFAGPISLQASRILDFNTSLGTTTSGVTVQLSVNEVTVPANDSATAVLTITTSASPSFGKFIVPVTGTNSKLGINRQIGIVFTVSPIIGLADFHTHQFGYLGFGGRILSHSVDPTDPCRSLLPHDKSTLRIKDLVRDGLFAEASRQAEQGQCYPTITNLASQRIDTGNLRRAWQYGLRLIVMFAVNSEFLCEAAELVSGTCPRDKEAIELQIQAAKDLEAQIDVASGGPGQGWYRIVYTPEQARDVISQGKLAVVLGVESSNAFGCSITYRTNVSGASLVGNAPNETAWQVSCGLSLPGLESFQTQQALALFEHYWQLGVRHFFPIHNIDGTAGGTALSIPILHAENNPARQAKGDWFNRVPDIDRMIRDVRPPIQALNCGSRFDFDGGRCNALGLTETGRYLIRMMASYGAVIDIDHMSWKAKRELLSDDGLLGGVYPFVSSHSGILEINHGDKSNEGQLAVEDFNAMVRAGGAFAPIIQPVTSTSDEDTYPPGATVAPHKCGGTSESFVQTYRYVVDKLKAGKLISGKPAFVGVGIGTDFGAPVPIVVAPRFEVSPVVGTSFGLNITLPNIVSGAPLTGPGGHCYDFTSSEPRVTYPFTSRFAQGVMFDKSTTPWGGRSTPYDISFDGVVHIGMIPDFVEELRVLGLSDDDLQPLWYGAEAYIRAWESSMAWQGTFNTEDDKSIIEDCRRLREELLKFDTNMAATFTRWKTTLKQLKQKGCHGMPTERDDMRPNHTLKPEQSITSANGQYTFIYQGDGNLVLYRNQDRQPLWASNTDGSSVGICVMQRDGNLVIYDAFDNPIWASNTSDPDSWLIVQDDGNVVIYRPNNTPVWATNTVQR